MMNYPDIQEKVYDEIVHEIGTNREPKGQDKPKLHYVNATILETQRLATISPFAVMHGCTRDTKINGYTIPRGATIFPHLDSVMLDEKIWGDPLNFRPDRFLEDGQFHCPEQFVAFGLGRRACLGESLARMELFLIAVSVIQKFKIIPKPGSPPPPRTYVMGSTCPPTPYLACFVERD